MLSPTQDASTAPPPRKRLKTSDDRVTLVCAVRGILGRVFTVTIHGDASIHDLKKRIHHENISELSHTTPTMIDIFSTEQFPGGWVRLDGNGCKEETAGSLQSIAPLLSSQRIRHYFPSTTPAFDSGVVHVVAEVVAMPMDAVIPNVAVTPLPDDKPKSAHETFTEESDRYKRVEKTLGLFVHWCIDGTDFSQQHKYQGARWLTYEHEWEGTSRVFIGGMTTWRELYVACNQAVQMVEGWVRDRYVEKFNPSKDGLTLGVWIGT